METLLLGLLLLLLLVVVVLLVLQFRNSGASAEMRIATLNSRLAELAPLGQAVQDIRLRMAD